MEAEDSFTVGGEGKSGVLQHGGEQQGRWEEGLIWAVGTTGAVAVI